MSRLATEVGLGQSSLYYYFRSREEVVAALVARANVVPLALIERVTAGAGSVPAKLYRFIRGDVEALCDLPFDINEIHRVAARERERFAVYWQERARLERRLTALLREGVAAGTLRPIEPRLTTALVLGADEGTQNWYRLRPTSSRKVALAVAEVTVSGLLASDITLDAVVSEVARIDD